MLQLYTYYMGSIYIAINCELIPCSGWAYLYNTMPSCSEVLDVWASQYKPWNASRHHTGCQNTQTDTAVCFVINIKTFQYLNQYNIYLFVLLSFYYMKIQDVHTGTTQDKALTGCQPGELIPKVLLDKVRAHLRNAFINLHKTYCMGIQGCSYGL